MKITIEHDGAKVVVEHEDAETAIDIVESAVFALDEYERPELTGTLELTLDPEKTRIFFLPFGGCETHGAQIAGCICN